MTHNIKNALREDSSFTNPLYRSSSPNAQNQKPATSSIQRQRPSPGLVQHSDRGVQYACDDYQAALEAAGIVPSMSRRANPLDNAPMESFFHTLKTELVHHRTYATRDDAKRDLFAYVEGFYNRQRLHSTLDYRTPDQAERQAADVA
jgi:putative transposase